MNHPSSSTRDHWETVYRTKSDAELSWYQDEAAMSLRLIDEIPSIDLRSARVVDIGGGQSAFAGAMLDRGVASMTVVDIAEAALERARVRLGDRAHRVTFVAANVLEAGVITAADLWHDRAVFHFLSRPEDRLAYVRVAARTVVPGGHLLVATFARSGPERCSGLDVCRHDVASLTHEFAPSFTPIADATESHRTPWGKQQDFVYAVLRRVDKSS